MAQDSGVLDTKPAKQGRRRERDGDAEHGPESGTMDAQARVDAASADSFPASDPPASMASVIPGGPRR